MSSFDDVAALTPHAGGALALPSFAVEHLVAPPPPPGRRQRVGRAFQLALAIALNIALFFALFYRTPYTLPPLSKEPEAISVELVPPQSAPKPPPRLQQQQQPEPEVKQPEKKEAYEFKGSGDVTKEKAGKKLTVEAEEKAPTPEKKAEKPKIEAPKTSEAAVPDWAKKLASGYDLPTQRDSSARRDRSAGRDDSYDTREGEGAGDEYSNQLRAQINAHTHISVAMLQRILRPTVVSITIDRRGNLSNVVLVQGSGLRDFDISVIQGVIDAAPFRPLPPGSPDMQTLVWTLPQSASGR